MRAAVLVETGRIEIEDRPDPVPGPHDLVIEVGCAGVCGTDLALWSGDYETKLPLVLGHEFCGTVVAVGDGVGDKWLDAYVTSEVNLTCLAGHDPEPCAACRRRMSTHCLRRRALGIHGADGAFAERVLVPAAAAHVLPEDLPAWSGAIVEPLAAAMRIFELTPLAPTDTVVVLGAGRLGLLACSVARSFGARVVAVSRSRAKRALALRFGANEALDAGEGETAGRIREITDGFGADVVVECTGSPEGLAQAIPLVRPRGTVAVKTTCGRPAEGLATTAVAVREITLQGSRCGPFGKAIGRLAAGLVPVDDYVSGVYPLEDVTGALDAAARSTKVLIEP